MPNPCKCCLKDILEPDLEKVALKFQKAFKATFTGIQIWSHSGLQGLIWTHFGPPGIDLKAFRPPRLDLELFKAPGLDFAAIWASSAWFGTTCGTSQGSI